MKVKPAASLLPIVFIGTLVFLSIATEQGICQSQYRLGPLLGYYANYHTAGLPYIVEPDNLFYPPSSGSGATFGLNLQRNLDPSWSIGVKIAYNNLNAKSDRAELVLVDPEGELYQIELIRADSNPDPLTDSLHPTFVASHSTSYQTLSLELSSQWRPLVNSSGAFGFDLGFTSHYAIERNSIEILQLEEPQNARFVNPNQLPVENNGRQFFLYDDEIPDSYLTRFGVRGGIFAEFGNRNSGMVVTPGLYYEYGLTPVQKNSDWYIHRLGVEVAMLFGL